MNSSLNHVYRIVWNAALGLWQVASEATKGRGKTGSSQQARKARRALAAASALALASPAAWAVLPTGGNVVAGSATISQAGNALNINQGSDKAAIDWQSFSIGQGSSVNFVQPSSSSVALNRVLGSDVSVIQGAISANGQVFLVNQNGVLFTPTAQVNVGGIVASTQNISTDDFMAGKYEFSGDSTASVENKGKINAAQGGVVALIAAKVINSGTITAPQGTVGLAAGNTVLVDLGGPVKIQVTEGALNAAIEQSGGIRADGGTVYLTAKAAGNLAASVINHTGVTKALSMAALTGEAGEVAQATGSIALSADLVNQAGTLDVSGLINNGRGGQVDVLAGQYTDSGTTLADGSQQGGSIDVRAKNITQTSSAVVSASSSEGEGGRVELIGDLGHGIGQFGGKIYATGRRRGGFVDTSGAKVILNDSLRVDTSSADGEFGTWLIDPIDFTIAASGGDLTGTQLGQILTVTNFTIQTDAQQPCVVATTCGPGKEGNGDIFVNDNVTWSSPAKLTLRAHRNIAINKTITANGATGSLALEYGQGSTTGSDGNYFIAAGAKVNLQAGQNFSTKQGTAGTTRNFTVITALGVQGSRSTADLQGIAGNRAGNYALGANIDASATSGWNAEEGFAPIENFTGQLEGLGHTVSNLTINLPFSTNGVGLFENLNAGSAVQHLGLTNVNITGGGRTGGIAGSGNNGSLIRNSYTTGSISCVMNGEKCGGILGIQQGATLQSVYSNASVSAAQGFTAGGLVGLLSSGTVSDSYATGNITTGFGETGGLVGEMEGGSITRSFATGKVSSSDPAIDGGLVGRYLSGMITASFWDTQTSMTDNGVGTAGSNPGSGITGRTTADMQKISTFQSAGWNITGRDGTYPTLTFGSGSIWRIGPTTSPIFIRLDCGLCESIYGETPLFSFKSFTAASGGTAVTDAMLTGTALYSLTSGGMPAGTVLARLTDAGTYAVTYTSGLTGDAMYELSAGAATNFTIKPKLLTVAIQAALGGPFSKVYDGNQNTTLATNNFAISGFVDQQGVGASVTGVTSGTFNNANVAQATTITAELGQNSIVLPQTAKASNYTLPTTVTSAGTITAKGITVSGLTAKNKVYDSTRTAMLTGTAVLDSLGLIEGDTVNVTGTASGLFADKQVGTNKVVTITGLTLGGTDAGNYNITSHAATSANITQAALTISGLTAANKTYDGTRTATVSNAGAAKNGLFSGDTVTVTATGLFSDKNAGNGKTVALTSTYGGADAGNYTITGQSSTTANITKREITVAPATAVSKAYDGLTAAKVTAGALKGLVAGESLVASATGYFASADVGTNKLVNTKTTIANGTNGLAANYTLTNAAGTTTANITKANYVTIGAAANAMLMLSKPVVAQKQLASK